MYDVIDLVIDVKIRLALGAPNQLEEKRMLFSKA